MLHSFIRPRATALGASLLALSLSVGAAVAQTPAPYVQTAPMQVAPSDTAAPPRPHVTLKERFATANTTNDGRLTLAQAQAGLPRVARNFTAIDKDNKGYVTLTDVQSYVRDQRAMRRQAAPPSTNG